MLNFCSDAVNLPQIMEYSNMDDLKYAVLPVAITREEECNIVTLGIGHDVTSERKMRLHFPDWCRFTGADPSVQINKVLYESIGGTYHKVAVGVKNGVQRARVYEGFHLLAILGPSKSSLTEYQVVHPRSQGS
ncbi:unnamed protein product [Gongylonema pulchrum]|uniref:Copine domain-containing protein n=1 Tax=Gongylonema pulchrum TaxID=637853 RepID=A0A183D7N7_9BILA|nr:unnamed protein product [Gongylonema pulchrum]